MPALDVEGRLQVAELIWATAGFVLGEAEAGRFRPGLRLIRRFTRTLFLNSKEVDISDLTDVELWAGGGFIAAALCEVAGEAAARRWEIAFLRSMAERNGLGVVRLHPTLFRRGGGG